MQFAFNIERRLHPIWLTIDVISPFIILIFLLEFAWRNPERNSNFDCSHHQTLYLLGLGCLDDLFILLLLRILCLADIGLRIGIVLETFSTRIKRLLLAKSKFRVHLLYFILDRVVDIRILDWRWWGLLLLFEVDYFGLLP